VVVFELVIALLFAGAMLAAWGRRFSLPYPALLALAGAGLALLPGVDRQEIRRAFSRNALEALWDELAATL